MHEIYDAFSHSKYNHKVRKPMTPCNQRSDFNVITLRVREARRSSKACVVRDPHVIMTPLITRGTDSESRQEAKGVEDGLSVTQSGAVKTLEKCGSQTVYEVTERFGNVPGQVDKMKVAVTPQKPRKQIMRNSFEQAKSRRYLTANVENKWLSNLHENVNSANLKSANTFSGISPESRKHQLPLPKPLTRDAFCARMAPHIFSNPNKALHTLICLLEPSRTLKTFRLYAT